MAEHPIQGLMNVTMDKIRQMADSNTIIGKPIQTEDGTTILPVSKVSFGFASAGTDFDELRILPDFGGPEPVVEDRISFRVSARLLFIVLAAVRVLYEFWREKVLDVFI